MGRRILLTVVSSLLAFSIFAILNILTGAEQAVFTSIQMALPLAVGYFLGYGETKNHAK